MAECTGSGTRGVQYPKNLWYFSERVAISRGEGILQSYYSVIREVYGPRFAFLSV